jgi:ribose/xylose/arabinose/galactoside ABC-type transport system permease subunit
MKARVKLLRYLIGAVICLVAAAFIPHFLTVANLMNVIRQASIIAIPAIGLTMVMIIKGIDLSTSGIISFIPMVFVILVSNNISWVVAMLVVIIAGTLIGLLDGVVIAKIEVPPFISTLVFGSICSGLALVLGNGGSTSVALPESFSYIGNGELAGFMPVANLLLVLFTVLGVLVLSRTAFGNHIYAIGYNETIVRQEGVNVDRVKIAVYAIGGFCSSVAGIMLTSKLSTAHPVQGTPYQLDCIAACIVGGVSMLGGEGYVLNSVLGALFIAALRNVLNMLRIHPFIQNLMVGILIIAIVAASILRKQRVQKRTLSY